MDDESTPTPDLETWKNPTPGRVWVNRLDHRGELTRTEMVNSGKTFHISSRERRLNQEMAYNPELDVFSNGTLEPVRLIEGDADTAAFAANPNLMTEGDMGDLLKPNARAKEAFVERLGEIRNSATLERLLAKAREQDAPLSRVEAIQGRMVELASEQGAVTSEAGPALDRLGRPEPAAPSTREKARAVTPG